MLRSQRTGVLAQRSSIEWIARGFLALAVAIIGLLSITYSVAQRLTQNNAALARQLAPYDGRITARLAASLSMEDATAADRRRAVSLAKQALRQDPTAIAAVSALGINAQIRGDTSAARRAFTYAETLSRRDLATQLWSIEDAVARGDIPAALNHYDIALRNKPATSAMLFPILASAINDPAIRIALIRKLLLRPRWSEDFVNYMATNASDPRTTASLFLGLHRAGMTVPEAARSRAVNALLAAGRIEDAWSYYAVGRPGMDRRRSRDAHFATIMETPSQLDWMPINNGTISTSIQQGVKGGIVEYNAPSSVGGSILQQYQLLSPGKYQLKGRSSGSDVDAPRPYWLLSCPDGRELGRVDLPAATGGSTDFVGELIVPARGCPMQALTLMARPTDAVSGLSGQIEWVQLAPAP